MRLYIKTLRTFTTKGEGWHEIDLYDNVSIPLTFKVSDIREFGSKTSGYSLDFEIPHTNNNGQLFGIAEEIDAYDATFEWGKDYPAYLTDNGMTIFNGQFRLKKVMKKDAGRHIYYIGYLYGGAKAFVDTLGTQTLIGNDEADDDIDFAYLNTPSTQMTLAGFADRLARQNAGWGLTLIDKTNKGQTSFSSGKQVWNTTECSPYLFVKEILDQIFEKAGYFYDSDFFSHAVTMEDPRWRNTIGQFDFFRLIYAYMQHNSSLHGEYPITSVINQVSEQSYADVVSQSFASGSSLGQVDVISHSLVIDSQQYTLTEQNVQSSLADWQFVAPEGGQYKIAVKMPLTMGAYMLRTTDNQPLGLRESVTAYTGTTFTLWVQLEKNGRTIANDQRIVHAGETIGSRQPFGNQAFPQSGWIEIISEELNISLDNLELAQGDVLTMYTWMQLPMNVYIDQLGWVSAWSHGRDFYYPATIALRLSATAEGATISISRNDGFYEGASFFPNSILNPKTTKVDFFTNLLKMFNLYVEDVSGKVDRKTGAIYRENTLRIEPYEIFYAPQLAEGQSNTKDWTEKIDWETVEYRRFDDYLYNIQAFTKEQNEDFYDEDYNATYIVPYGNRNVKGKYCVSADKNENSPKVGAYLCGIVNSQTDTLQCPKAFKINNKGEVDTKKEYAEGIFFLWDNDMTANTEIGTNNTIRLHSVLNSNYIDITEYGCADTSNDGYGNDTANLNFGKVGEFYQVTKGKELSDNDLYNAFYKKQYEEYTSADAKIMRCRIFLNAYDIATLQMSDTIIVKGNLWHIIEINQWKNEQEAVEIELIKTKP
mgnify:CR=1 FL=1